MDSEVIKLPKVFFDYIMSTKHDKIQNTWMYYLQLECLFPNKFMHEWEFGPLKVSLNN